MIGTSQKAMYMAFGFKISSEFSLPELTKIYDNIERVDIVIKRDDLSGLWKYHSREDEVFYVKESLVMFQIPDTATFCIKDGTKIIVSPMSGADENKIRLYILGTCMGTLLMQRKILPLHGSAVVINGKAYAFVGHSGAGKSTLASAFIREGYHLLSDDVIPVTLSINNIPFVIPSYPQQKLWQESLNEFGMQSHHYLPLFERETKYAVPITSSFFDKPLPLAGVFELQKTQNENIELNSIQGLERFPIILNHTYRNSLIRRLGLTEWHFTYSSKIISKVQIYNLKRPIHKFTAQKLASLIQESIN